MNITFIRNVIIFSVVYTLLFLGLGLLRGSTLLAEAAVMVFVGGILLGGIFGYVSQKLPFPKKKRFAFIWIALYVIMSLSNLLELYFFSANQEAFILSELGVGLVGTLIYAALLTTLFKSNESGGKVKFPIKRIIVASLIYIPIYLGFGMVVFPFVGPFYNDPSLGLNLVIPGLEIILPLQILRGLLYVLVLLPFIEINTSRRNLLFLLTAILFVPGALIGFLVPGDWPVALKFFHGLEILADYFVFSAVMVWLFKKKR